MTDFFQLQFTPEAQKLFQRISVCCPTDDDFDQDPLWTRSAIKLEDIRDRLPVASADLALTARELGLDNSDLIDEKIIIRNFAGPRHQTGIKTRISPPYQARTAKILAKKLGQEPDFSDSQTTAALAAIDTLTVAKVLRTFNHQGRKRADLQINRTVLQNSTIPLDLKRLGEGETVFTHYTVTCYRWNPEEASPELIQIMKQQQELFVEIEKDLPNTIDCANFCPTSTSPGLNLTAWAESHL
jgi:hypothetical protein